MADGLVSIESDDITSTIKALDETRRRLATEDRKAFKDVATTTTGWVASAARAGSPAERRFAGALKPRSTQTMARIAVLSSGRNAGALATFWGMERRTGWNARNLNSRPQAPKWVGSSWVAGRPGEGPYVFRKVIPARVAAIGQMIEDARMRAFSATFHGGG